MIEMRKAMELMVRVNGDLKQSIFNQQAEIEILKQESQLFCSLNQKNAKSVTTTVPAAALVVKNPGFSPQDQISTTLQQPMASHRSQLQKQLNLQTDAEESLRLLIDNQQTTKDIAPKSATHLG